MYRLHPHLSKIRHRWSDEPKSDGKDDRDIDDPFGNRDVGAIAFFETLGGLNRCACKSGGPDEVVSTLRSQSVPNGSSCYVRAVFLWTATIWV